MADKLDFASSLLGMMDGMTDTPTPPTMTGDEFAVRAGVAPDTVNRWIHDRQPIPAWAVAHLRLLLAADQFHRLHVAPPPRTRRKAGAGDQAEGGDA